MQHGNGADVAAHVRGGALTARLPEGSDELAPRIPAGKTNGVLAEPRGAAKRIAQQRIQEEVVVIGAAEAVSSDVAEDAAVGELGRARASTRDRSPTPAEGQYGIGDRRGGGVRPDPGPKQRAVGDQ